MFLASEGGMAEKVKKRSASLLYMLYYLFFFCLTNLSSDDQCLSWLIRGRAALVYLSGKWILVIASVV